MADIRPFRALRYAAVDSLGAVIAPPYDVISAREQDELYARDPHNVVRLELPRPGSDQSSASRYSIAAETLRSWRRRNALALDPSPVYYAYEERFHAGSRDRVRRGVFGIVRLHAWEERIVLPHERTRPSPKADRLDLLRACRTQVSPIFSLFEDSDGVVRSLLDGVMRGVPVACAQVRPGASPEIAISHQLWQIGGEMAARLSTALTDRPIFIADGHHRYETALAYRDEIGSPGAGSHPADFTLMLLVPVEDEGLIVLPTHRLIRLPDGATIESMLDEGFDVEAADGMTGVALFEGLLVRRFHGPVFCLIGPEPGRARYLHVRRLPDVWPSPRTWRSLDVGLLQTLIVDPIEARNPGTAVDFTRDPEVAAAYPKPGATQVAILVPPTDVQHILGVARAGERMPEKSTYFSPKVATGIVMYPLA